MYSKFIKSHWKDLMLYRLKLTLDSDQDLALSRQKQILRSTSPTNLQNQNNEDFFIQLLYAWLHLTNNNLSAPMSIEEILDQPIFLNPHTRLDFSSNKPYFRQFTIIRDLCRFLQPSLISSPTFRKKLDFPTANHNIYINLPWANSQ